jgi:chromosome segregation ATPase
MSEDSTRGNLPDEGTDVRGESGWITTRVAAEALGVDPRTVRTYIRRGDLAAKVEGEGVEKTYLVSVDSVYSLRDRRGSPRKDRGRNRDTSAWLAQNAEYAEEVTEMVRDLTAHLIRSTSEAADLRARLELTERTESSLREDRERLLEDLERERERAAQEQARAEEVQRDAEQFVQEREEAQEEARRLREELEAERSKGFWRRLFGR